MEPGKIKLEKLEFRSSTEGSYKKDFGVGKDALRQEGFPAGKTNDFIDSRITDKSIKKFNKHTSADTVLLSLPTKEGKKAENIIPKLYAKQMAERTGRTAIDLSDYLKVRQNDSARGSYTSSDRSENYFNIAFKSEQKRAELNDRVKDKKVLFVDDVLTTGETMVAMATYLKNKLPNLQIEGGNALAAVDIRTPTPRDMDRVTEKLQKHLDPSISRQEIRQTVKDSFSTFTRKKLMRFEMGIKNPEIAQKQYNTMHADNGKMQTSLKESLSGNLLRYPLDKGEKQQLAKLAPEQLEQSLKSRALLEHYPKAAFTKDIEGGVRLFADASKKEQLSLTGGSSKNEVQAITKAIGYIKEHKLDASINKNNDKGVSY